MERGLRRKGCGIKDEGGRMCGEVYKEGGERGLRREGCGIEIKGRGCRVRF